MKTFTQELIVTNRHTAIYLGSGSLEVFATPAMIALMENTAMQSIDNLDEGFTTVGIEMNVQHLKATPVGEKLSCTAELIRQEKKLYEFSIIVRNAAGIEIGTAIHKRVAVNIAKFMTNL